MCRLLGFAAPTPHTVASVLGDAESVVFRDMAGLHRDGWGTSWIDERGGLGLEADKEERSGLDDPRLFEALTEHPSTARVLHLRLATDGMSCRAENTHPFVAEDFAFEHNGSLPDVAAIERLLSPSVWARLQGDTDSERYFGLIRTYTETGMSLRAATVKAVRQLRALFPSSSLNALLLSGTQLIAVHASSHTPSPVHEFNKRGITIDSLPSDHVDGYYLMRIRHSDDGTVVIASSGLDIEHWEALPAETVTVVDLATLAIEHLPLNISETDPELLPRSN